MEVSAGAFGIFDDSKEPLRLGLEYLGKSFSPWSLTPGIGINLTEGGARFTYLDLRKDWWLGPQLVRVGVRRRGAVPRRRRPAPRQ